MSNTPHSRQSVSSRYGQVERVLNAYFDALYHSDAEAISRLFHARAVYATGDESPALIRDLPTYLKVLESRISPASRQEARNDRIDSIEFAGANTARAQVRCSIADRDFVDYLTLIREQGQWRIIAKVFQIMEGSDHALR